MDSSCDLAATLLKLGITYDQIDGADSVASRANRCYETSPGTLRPIRAPYYLRLRRVVAAGSPVLLVGPAATGKSTAIRQLAAENEAELYVQQCYATLCVEDIRGTRGLKDGATVFEPGTLTKSLMDDRGWYFLEEINMADPGIVSLLNNLLDGSREITIPETGERLTRKNSWRFFGACNLGYQGTHELNQALVSRCVVIECDGFNLDEQTEILRREYPALGEMAESLVLIGDAVREAHENGAHEFDMCLRTMFQMAEEFLASGDLLDAFRLTVLPKIGDRITFSPVRDGLMRAIELLHSSRGS